MTAFPPIVSVAVRTPPVLAPVEYATVPLPDPDAPDVTVSHDALLAAVQPQPVPDVTATAPLPAVAAVEMLDGDTA